MSQIFKTMICLNQDPRDVHMSHLVFFLFLVNVFLKWLLVGKFLFLFNLNFFITVYLLK